MDQNIRLAVAQVLAEALGGSKQNDLFSAYKHDLPAGYTIGTNLLHGPTGIFGAAGIDRNVFSTRVQPRGLLSILSARPTVDTNPLVAFLTGFTAPTGSEPDAPCEACVTAGQMKSCTQGSRFGLICRDSEVLDITNVGTRTNRGEFYDLRLVNDPMLGQGDLWVPGSVPPATADLLQREVLARWYTMGAAFEQTLGPMVFTGNPANNVGTGYAEYQGLELLVATGHVDVLDNQTSCPSLDSDIKDMNYTSVNTDAATIFAYMQMVYRFVKHNAETMGFMPVTWKWVIKDSLFRMLADYWPCVYAAGGCGATGNDLSNNVDGLRMVAMADDMYNNRYLRIDGENVPVIIDDSLPYEKSGDAGSVLPAGTFASDIYLLPFTVRGGVEVLFMEYFNYMAPNGVMQAVMDGRLGGNAYWTDGGRWLWTVSRERFCVQWTARIQPRLRLLTPHLAGRLQNIQWTPLQMFREPFNAQGYFTDGGLVVRSNAPYTIT